MYDSPSSLPDGSVLCAVGYEDGQVRVYSVSLSLSWGSEFTLASSLATEVPRTSNFPGTRTLHLTPLVLQEVMAGDTSAPFLCPSVVVYVLCRYHHTSDSAASA